MTGAAGFIGSHLCEALLADGEDVRAVDSFSDYYPRPLKEANVSALADEERFEFIEGDLAKAPLEALVEGADVVYHVAAQPGVRSSWGGEFATYVRDNVLVTQRLLETCRELPPRKLVFASSSSVYGNAASYPTREDVRPQPISPYGVTKLAAEHLCELYRVSFGVPTASLRLFTVYGPRQRPDMAFSRLVRCAVQGGLFELYGDGEQTRDCTFVADVVTAMRDAAAADWVGVANVGGGQQVSMNAAIARLEELCGPIDVVHRPHAAGDVRHTGAATRVAAEAFGFDSPTKLEEGLAAMVDWERAREPV